VNRKILYKFLFSVLVPLIVGITIYYLWRGIGVFGLKPFFANSIPHWIIYNLPDGLWFFSLLSCLFLIWDSSTIYYLITWICIFFFLTIFSEILQLLSLIQGTFDIFDIIAYLISCIIVLFLNRNVYVKRNIK
jgi:hypothetical protein